MVAELGRAGEPTTVATGLSARATDAGAPTAARSTFGSRRRAPTRPASPARRFAIEIATSAERPAAAKPRSAATRSRRHRPARRAALASPAPPPEDYVVEVGRLFDGVRARLSPPRRRARAARPDRRDRAARACCPTPGQGHRRARRHGHSRAHRCARASVGARRRAPRTRVARVRRHYGARDRDRCGRSRRARRVLGQAAVRSVRGSSFPPRRAAEVARDAGTPAPCPSARIRASPTVLATACCASSRSSAFAVLDGRVPAPRGAAYRLGAHYELELSPELSSYQDSLGTVITSYTVLPSSARDRLPAFTVGRIPRRSRLAIEIPPTRRCSRPSERAGWRPRGRRRGRCRGSSRTIARLVRAGGRVAIGSDAPAVPYGLRSPLRARADRGRQASRTTKFCGSRRRKARWRSDSSGSSARWRKASSPTSS